MLEILGLSVLGSYLTITIIGAVIVLFSFILGDILDVDVDDGPSPISPVFIGVFLAFFGAFGMMYTEGTGMGGIPIMFLSAISTVPIYVGAWLGIKKFVGETTGIATYESITGKSGVVTVTIPANEIGQISVFDGLITKYYSATSLETIPLNSRVVVTHYDGNIAVVEPISIAATAA